MAINVNNNNNDERNKRKGKILNTFTVIGLRNQQIRSYLIDESEEPEKQDFLQFLLERWNMLTVMSIVIAVFVFNESHRPSH